MNDMTGMTECRRGKHIFSREDEKKRIDYLTATSKYYSGKLKKYPDWPGWPICIRCKKPVHRRDRS